jgi:hypothetical protein
MARQKLGDAPEVDEDDDVAGAQFENNEDGLVINLEGVEELKFENLPPNTYDIIVEDCQYKKSKSSNKPMWDLKLNIVGGEYDGRKLFTFFSFSKGALPGTKSNLAVIAPELLSKEFRVNDPETVASIIGRRARVKVGIQKAEEGSDYEDRNQIKRWMQPTGAAAFV